MRAMQKAGIAAICMAGFIATSAQAVTYNLTVGGLTEIVSSTFGPGAISISPNPTGFDAGFLDIDINTGTGDVTLLPSSGFELADFEVTITAPGFGVTTVDAVDTTLDFVNGASGNLGGGLTVTLTSSGPAPSVLTDGSFVNCSGAACVLIPLLDLNLASYTVELTFSSDFSSFTGVAHGITANNSTMDLDLAGTVVPLPASAWLLGSALLGFVGISRRARGNRA